jgi:hypothetical protein
LQALAYTQGTEIHVAPGQEEHLPHEVWHVVQQAQGRVKPTMQMKGGVPVNDDVGLEQEADVMGVKALQVRHREDTTQTQKQEGRTAPAANHGSPIQLRPIMLKDGRVIESRQHTKDELHEMFVSHIQTHLATAEQVDAAIDDREFYRPTTVTDHKGRIKINPEIMDEGLEPEDDLSRPPVHNEFHQRWQSQRDDPFNMKYPNWLPPLPSGLKGSARNDYMKYRNDVYPTVEVFTGDTLHHFTTHEGARGIGQTGMMYPSVVAGMQTTHYGRGVYFTDLGAGGVESLRDKTHGDVTKSIYTRDSAENRRRSNNLAEVNVSDRLVLKYKLRGKDPVLMHPSTEPIDVMGRLKIGPTSDYVQPDIPPLPVVHSGPPKKARAPKPPSVPDKSLEEFYKQYKRDL